MKEICSFKNSGNRPINMRGFKHDVIGLGGAHGTPYTRAAQQTSAAQ